MPVITDALVYNAGRIASTSAAPIGNLVKGAQLGLGPNIVNIDAAAPLTLMPVYPVLVHSPTMFAAMPHMDAILKAMVERHAKAIDGIDLEYTLETAEHPVGSDGQNLQVPTNAKRTPPSPNFTWGEVKGNLIWNFIRTWIGMIKSADTQASTMGGIVALNEALPPQTPSYYSMDVMFLQMDPTLRPENMIDAWFITNMFPTGTSPAGYKRQVGQTDSPDRTIPFTGLIQHNDNTREVGRAMAQVLSLNTVDFNIATPAARTIAARLAQEGLRREVSEAMTNFVRV